MRSVDEFEKLISQAYATESQEDLKASPSPPCM